MVCKDVHVLIPGAWEDAPLCGKRDLADVKVTNQDLVRKIILDYPAGAHLTPGAPEGRGVLWLERSEIQSQRRT